MAFLEFKIVDKKLFKMTQEQRIAELNRVNKETEAKIAAGGWSEEILAQNPFPKWLRDMIKGLGPAKYERDNGVYLLEVPGSSEDDAEDKYQDFKDAYTEATDSEGADPERKQWAVDNHVHVSISMVGEGEAMRELEAHHGAAPAALRVEKEAKKGRK